VGAVGIIARDLELRIEVHVVVVLTSRVEVPEEVWPLELRLKSAEGPSEQWIIQKKVVFLVKALQALPSAPGACFNRAVLVAWKGAEGWE
jgi:hypothetical protein